MQSSIVNGSVPIDFSGLSYTEPKQVGQAKVINVKLKGKNLQIATPLMSTWGASDYEGNEKFELSLLFPREDDKTPATEALLQNMKDMRDKIVADVMTNSKKWLNKSFKDVAIVEELFNPILKYRKDKDTGDLDMNSAPSIRAKFQKYGDGIYQCNIYDENQQPLWLRDNAASYQPDNVPMNYFKKGMQIATIIECGGIWIIGGKTISLTWKLVQAVTQKSPDDVFSGGCLLNISNEDKVAIANAKVEPQEQNNTTHAQSNNTIRETSTTVESSDDDAEEEEDEEEEEEEEEEVDAVEEVAEPIEPTKPVIKKKVVRAKKASA
jgi:hypothetical protein